MKNRALLPFVVRLLQSHEATLDARGKCGTQLAKAGRRLVRAYAALGPADKRGLTGPELEALRVNVVDALQFWKAAGGHCYPKHHMAVHLATRQRHGLAMCSTDRDESFHKVCKRVYHSAVHPRRILAKLWLLTHLDTLVARLC